MPDEEVVVGPVVDEDEPQFNEDGSMVGKPEIVDEPVEGEATPEADPGDEQGEEPEVEVEAEPEAVVPVEEKPVAVTPAGPVDLSNVNPSIRPAVALVLNQPPPFREYDPEVDDYTDWMTEKATYATQVAMHNMNTGHEVLNLVLAEIHNEEVRAQVEKQVKAGGIQTMGNPGAVLNAAIMAAGLATLSAKPTKTTTVAAPKAARPVGTGQAVTEEGKDDAQFQAFKAVFPEATYKEYQRN